MTLTLKVRAIFYSGQLGGALASPLHSTVAAKHLNRHQILHHNPCLRGNPSRQHCCPSSDVHYTLGPDPATEYMHATIVQ